MLAMTLHILLIIPLCIFNDQHTCRLVYWHTIVWAILTVK